MRTRILCLLPITAALLVFSCKDSTPKVVKKEPVVFQKEGELRVFRIPGDSLLANWNIEIAESDYEVETGLMYRAGMEDDQAMLFIFPDEAMHYFYMKNTEFPLDILFIKSDKRVGSIQKNAKPYDENSLSSVVPIRYVLEINAGLSDKLGIKVGDSVAFDRQ